MKLNPNHFFAGSKRLGSSRLIYCTLTGGGILSVYDESVADGHRQVYVPSTLTLKTNAVGWEMLIPNLIPDLGWRHWSVQFPKFYSNLNYFSRRVKFHTFALHSGVRYWVNSAASALSHTVMLVGAHLGIAWYNMVLGGIARIQDRLGTRHALDIIRHRISHRCCERLIKLNGN